MIGYGSLLEKPSKFYNKFSIPKLDDLTELEVAKIVHAHLANNYSPKLSKFFILTKIISLVPPE